MGSRPLAMVLACAMLACMPRFATCADLQAAIRNGDSAALERALMSTPREEAGLFLHLAIIMEDLQAIRLLHEHGADLEASNRDSGAHPLHVAADIGMPPVVNLLVDLGAELEARDSLGRTPLIQAAIAGNSAVVSVLLAAGANADAAESFHGTTALHLAAFRDRREIIDALLAYGAAVDVADKQGETPLFWAVGRGHAQAITLLVNAGADVNHRNHAGISPLGAAAFAHDREATARLLKILGAEE
jgi:ankyrin repeat protein